VGGWGGAATLFPGVPVERMCFWSTDVRNLFNPKIVLRGPIREVHFA